MGHRCASRLVADLGPERHRASFCRSPCHNASICLEQPDVCSVQLRPSTITSTKATRSSPSHSPRFNFREASTLGGNAVSTSRAASAPGPEPSTRSEYQVLDYMTGRTAWTSSSVITHILTRASTVRSRQLLSHTILRKLQLVVRLQVQSKLRVNTKVTRQPKGGVGHDRTFAPLEVKPERRRARAPTSSSATGPTYKCRVGSIR